MRTRTPHNARSRQSIIGAALALTIALTVRYGLSFADVFADAMLKNEEFRACFDQQQPLPRRLSSCTVLLEKETLEKHEYGMVFLARAQIHQKSGNDRAALQDLNSAVKIDPKSNRARVARGSYYLSKADYPAALDDFDAAVKLDPKDPIAYVNRGVGLNYLGRRLRTSAVRLHSIPMT
jgi:lipoprotein NlpI